MLRLAACLSIPVDIIEPCGFVFANRLFRRAGMDYLDRVDLIRHTSWRAYREWRAAHAEAERLVLASARAATPYTEFTFATGDTILMGRESSGVPPSVAQACDAALRIPLRPGMRSINVAQAAAMVLGEALRQTNSFPPPR